MTNPTDSDVMPDEIWLEKGTRLVFFNHDARLVNEESYTRTESISKNYTRNELVNELIRLAEEDGMLTQHMQLIIFAIEQERGEV